MTKKTKNCKVKLYTFHVSTLVKIEIQAVTLDHAVTLFKDYFGNIIYDRVSTPYNDQLLIEDSEFDSNNFV